MLQSTGKTIYSTVAQVCGALTNIVMDPIMIYGLLGFPRLGVKGAAYATVLGQAVSFIIAIVLQITRNREISISLKYRKPLLIHWRRSSDSRQAQSICVCLQCVS